MRQYQIELGIPKNIMRKEKSSRLFKEEAAKNARKKPSLNTLIGAFQNYMSWTRFILIRLRYDGPKNGSHSGVQGVMTSATKVIPALDFEAR